VTDCSGCPGMTAAGSFAVAPRYFSSIRSPSRRPFSAASFGLIHALGSHVIFVSGLGSSCSQPLLAKRPSPMVGSGRQMISSPLVSEVRGPRSDVRWVLGAAASAAAGPRSSVVGRRTLVPEIHPSCRTCFQKLSALLNGAPLGSVIVQPPTDPAYARVQ